tara:strand:- start:114 stop:371 length:258 start_codon:yes stop_codon:yes gene_type:complete
MCIGGGGRPAAPAPQPLPPPPPVPPAPPAPLPTPEPVEKTVNPQVRRAKSKKAKGEFAQGTSQLRVPLGSKVNTGQQGPAGGLNK